MEVSEMAQSSRAVNQVLSIREDSAEIPLLILVDKTLFRLQQQPWD